MRFERLLAQIAAFALLGIAAFSVSFLTARFVPGGGAQLEMTRQELAAIGNDIARNVSAALPARTILAPQHVAPATVAPTADVVVSQAAPSQDLLGKPVMSARAMLALTEARAQESVIANLSARTGGIVRLSDGSSLAIGPGAVDHDMTVTVLSTRSAVAETSRYRATGSALTIRFRPLMDGVAFADPATSPGAVATFASDARALSRGTVVVQRIVLRNGTSTTFVFAPQRTGTAIVTDVGSDHLLRFASRFGAAIIISRQTPRT